MFQSGSSASLIHLVCTACNRFGTEKNFTIVGRYVYAGPDAWYTFSCCCGKSFEKQFRLRSPEDNYLIEQHDKGSSGSVLPCVLPGQPQFQHPLAPPLPNSPGFANPPAQIHSPQPAAQAYPAFMPGYQERQGGFGVAGLTAPPCAGCGNLILQGCTCPFCPRA